MKLFIVSVFIIVFVSCDKVIEVELPTYEPELIVEMYLEEGKPLRCLLTESLPYTDTAINKPVNDALVVFSDGMRNDTLSFLINQDKVTGRLYNYFNAKLVGTGATNPVPGLTTLGAGSTNLAGASAKIYSLTVINKNKTITGKTSFSQTIPKIDSVNVRKSENKPDSFSVSVAISDPRDWDNYYRFLIGKTVNYFASDPTDFRVSDVSFDGKPFSFSSGVDFARNDTVTVRVYSLRKEHYEYLESIVNARQSNFNPFSQPNRIKSNVIGGLGIFTTIRYAERKIIIR